MVSEASGGFRVLEVLARQLEPSVTATDGDLRLHGQSGIAGAPVLPSMSAPRRVVPVAIPVIGGRPIRGRHLVRAPWAEPLAAFAGVMVETQLVPEEWLRPRSAARRAIDPPSALTEAPGRSPAIAPGTAATAAQAVSYPAIIAATVMTGAPYRPVRRVIPVSMGPMTAAPATVADAGSRREIAGLIAIPVVRAADGTTGAVVPSTAAAFTADPLAAPPVAAITPAAHPVRTATPAPARRGFVARVMVFAIGLVVSMVAFEAANRVGHR